jgi:hypothetical protein
MLPRAAAGILFALLIVAPLGGCSQPADIRSVADFDETPCALIAEDAVRQLVAEPIRELTRVEPTLEDASASDSNGTFACVYSFTAPESALPQVTSFTVTVAHADQGSQPLAICAAGAGSRNPGYKTHEIGDLACTSPSSDLWMRIGDHFYHVAVVAQPGFQSPVENSLALTPLILAVARAAADRMPRA